MSEMTLETMTKDECSLLLFLESRAVDHGGLVESSHMNKADFDIAKKWTNARFILFGRIKAAEIGKLRSRSVSCSHWVTLSGTASELAAQERKARSDRSIHPLTVEHAARLVLEARP